jgi:hypothetical protein
MDAPAPAPPTQFATPPSPPSERGAWVLACALGLLGVVVLVSVLTGLLGGDSAAAPPPTLVARVATPRAGAGSAHGSPAGGGEGAQASASGAPGLVRATGARALVQSPSLEEQELDARRFTSATHTHIARSWVEGFYPIYAIAQRTFGVDWLLIASIHAQETAFSTAPSTYHGLNFAHCCAGPMQFNVRNGPVSTWDLVANSYIYAKRPAHYQHMTATHPSVYDDFDAIMAAAHLLSADGAGIGLEDGAWWAAYDYYGHDATGVLYADQVLARAIGWSQHGFCIDCGVSGELVQAVQAAYGAPVLSALEEEERAAAAAEREKRASEHARRHARERSRAHRGAQARQAKSARRAH